MVRKLWGDWNRWWLGSTAIVTAQCERKSATSSRIEKQWKTCFPFSKWISWTMWGMGADVNAPSRQDWVGCWHSWFWGIFNIRISDTSACGFFRWEPLFHQSLFVESDMAPSWWPQFLHWCDSMWFPTEHVSPVQDDLTPLMCAVFGGHLTLSRYVAIRYRSGSWNKISLYMPLPCGNLKCQFLVDFPIKNCDFP